MVRFVEVRDWRELRMGDPVRLVREDGRALDTLVQDVTGRRGRDAAVKVEGVWLRRIDGWRAFRPVEVAG